MKEGFQSKFIREMLFLTKERVAYLGMKVPITPEIKQVEGTGRAHEYSYRNLLQFAIVEWLTEVGLSMRDVKYLLSVLENASEIGEMATPVAVSHYIPKECRVDVAAWPPREKGRLIVGEREAFVYIHEPDRVKNAFENYYSPSSDGELHFIMTKPGLPPDNVYILAITDDIAEFTQVISLLRAPTQMLINMKEIKFRVNVYIDVETWEPDD
jgi:hypothetical protein